MSSNSTSKRGAGWWHAPLYRLYESLTRSDSPRPADLIFVLAGRMERKPYGLELYRAGLAPRLLLSVGRFEVSRMRTIAFEGAEELMARRDRMAPEERHFFCEISAAGTRIEAAALRRWSTYGELLALRKFLERDMPRRVMIVSTDIHLRRVSVTFNKVFRHAPIEALYCPVPAGASSPTKEEWWTQREDRRYVLTEAMKLAGYRAILNMPEWAARRLMRLKT